MVRRPLRALLWRKRDKYLSDRQQPRPACRSRSRVRQNAGIRIPRSGERSYRSIARPHPYLIERGVLHALAAGDEIAVHGMDRSIFCLYDGRIVVAAAVVLLQVPRPLPCATLV